MRECGALIAGQVTYAFEPYVAGIGYETGDWTTGCWYNKCANGYAWYVANLNCQQGHVNKGMMHSGYPECPHGTYTGMTEWKAHCNSDTGWDTPGYRAL